MFRAKLAILSAGFLLMSSMAHSADSSEFANELFDVRSTSAEELSSSSFQTPTASKCLAPFKKLRRRLAWKTAWLVPVGLTGTEALTGLFAWVGPSTGIIPPPVSTGWFTLGVGLEYAGIGTMVGLGIFAYEETDTVVRLLHACHLVRVIEQSHGVISGDLTSKHGALDRFTRRLMRKYPELSTVLTEDEVAAQIVKWDENGQLCDGSLKAHSPRNRNLSQLLINPRELRRALKKGN